MQRIGSFGDNALNKLTLYTRRFTFHYIRLQASCGACEVSIISITQVAVYLRTHCNIGSKRAFPTGILDRWQLFTYLLTYKLFSSFIRRSLVSRACDWVMPALSAVLLTFSFQFSLIFFHVGSQAAAAAYVFYLILNIGRCRKCGKYVPCTQRTVQRKDFELILTVKMETRHPVGGSLGNEFPAICNHCGVMAAWNRKIWKFCEQFLLFLWKNDSLG